MRRKFLAENAGRETRDRSNPMVTQIKKAGILLAILAARVIGDECEAGLLVSVQNTTCDIGVLSFNFGQAFASAASCDDDTGAPLPTSISLNPANFEFTPLPTAQVALGEAATGYSITSLLGPESITAPPNGYSTAILSLDFSVKSRAGNIGGAGVSGATVSVSDEGFGYGFSLLEASDFTVGGMLLAVSEYDSYYTMSQIIPAGDTATGSSIVLQFYATNGATDEWAGPTTTFSLFTTTPVPESNSLIQLTTVAGLCGLLLRRRFSSR
jgi:hypothetical protein